MVALLFAAFGGGPALAGEPPSLAVESPETQNAPPEVTRPDGCYEQVRSVYGSALGLDGVDLTEGDARDALDHLVRLKPEYGLSYALNSDLVLVSHRTNDR